MRKAWADIFIHPYDMHGGGNFWTYPSPIPHRMEAANAAAQKIIHQAEHSAAQMNNRGVFAMQNRWNQNRILLRGRLAAPPTLSHANHGTQYFLFPLAVSRLSGAEDRLNVIAAQPLLEPLELDEGAPLTVLGEVRTFNNRSGVGSRLVVSVFARALSQEEGEDENRLELAGTLCKPPSLRSTPLGRTICDMILAVNRRYGRADYLPCIAWGSLAHQCWAMSVGDTLRLEGRLQSRIYTKEIDGQLQERTAFEVSIMSLEQDAERPLPAEPAAPV